MKKLIVMGIVMVMALSATAAFAAADNDWLINVKASTDATAKVGASNAIFGLKTATGDTFATLTTAANLAGSPEINYGDATHPYTSNYGAVPATAKRYSTVKFGGAVLGNTTNTVDWTFRVCGAANASLYLTAWNATGATNQIDAGFTQTIQLYESNAAGEKIGPAIWSFVAGKTSSWTSSGGIVGTAGDTYFQTQVTLPGEIDPAGGAYKYYVLEATVPEPGSMVALFSGLIGLVGFGIRRRK